MGDMIFNPICMSMLSYQLTAIHTYTCLEGGHHGEVRSLLGHFLVSVFKVAAVLRLHLNSLCLIKKNIYIIISLIKVILKKYLNNKILVNFRRLLSRFFFVVMSSFSFLTDPM